MQKHYEWRIKGVKRSFDISHFPKKSFSCSLLGKHNYENCNSYLIKSSTNINNEGLKQFSKGLASCTSSKNFSLSFKL